MNRADRGPRVLDDVRVLDFTSVIAGPYCTRMMADLGAEVLKIEPPPAGDILRVVTPMRGTTSQLFSAMNSGKKSLAMDLKTPAAIDVVKQLVQHYDVVVENFSPGVMARLGIDYDTLAAANPAIVMCSISGFGQSGPDANRPAYAPIVQAWCGYEDVTRRNQQLNKPLNMGLPIGDTTASLQGIAAINAALYYRARTGLGQHIDIAMFDALLATMAKDFQSADDPDYIERIYGPLETRDGYVIVTPLSERHFRGLVECMGQPHLLEHSMFANTRTRIGNYNELTTLVEQWTRTVTCEEAVAKLEAAQVPCARYRTISEVVHDRQLAHREMITEIEDAAGPLRAPNAPFHFSATHAAVRREVPLLGQHNSEVLASVLGMNAAQIAKFEAAGVIHSAPPSDARPPAPE